ncbi:glycerophosphodiester phosphodiesterase [Streptococcus mutans]|jgi:putative glycerophosphodiester phosphodiesterase|uniref:glycerophosphodiester phosphodiesterase n=1 Tax=Streptococcus mutans TaxID=1309 RepID=UPI000264EE64|nr:glycerophosphodiester phosphodiesterase family protein [Streptococcus mutans]EMC05420.1 putative glycerophosphoryl diester phosphodiesterase [Streptococcus mutans NLML5]EMC13411.1 putative glycerophosphoryl diester phosphodiesterase [Streptococcus mutans M2A]MCB4956676.1 glycerophosphodiester phosphodiesterase [Streptococcus mutans]MCB5015897.1 glycerophosphodiester phosphodiesterase [Streptococcus mutans]MCB5153184.1 glycerophosphodiester phosphodiesterase [Streptococcus mutans]
MTQIFAHRGSKVDCPENTLAAFKKAIQVGCDGIEIDVHRTKDNHLVVIHDEAVDRTSNGYGLVRQLTLKQIRMLDAGSWFHPAYFCEKIPTLEEVLNFLEEYGFQGTLNLEIKTNRYPYPKIEKQIAQTMQAKKRSFSHIYSSFNLFSLYVMRKHDPKAELAYLMKFHPFHFWLAQQLKFIKTVHSHSSFYENQVTKRKNKKPFRLWTVNNDDDMKKFFLSGIEGIITDKPEEAVKLRKSLQTKKE